MKKIEKFIIDNKLDFTGSGSGLNGNCVALAGFMCHLEDTEVDIDAHELILKLDISSDAKDELIRVFEYAWVNSYEDWWKNSEAHDEYVFD